MWSGLDFDSPTYRVPSNITAVIGGGYGLISLHSTKLISYRTDGKATVRAPKNGWQARDLQVYFSASYPSSSRSATRPIPSASSTSSSLPSPPASKKTNTGAIAGGVVGGVAVLAGVVFLAWFCLRRRRKQKQVTPPATDVTQTQAPGQHGAAEKYVATPTTVSYPSTYPSPHTNTPGYSPQTSPPPPFWSEHGSPSPYYQSSPPMPQHAWGSHDMSIQYANQQPFYPPPPDPSQSPTKHAYMDSAELPPNEVLEMPEVRSPAPKKGF